MGVEGWPWSCAYQVGGVGAKLYTLERVYIGASLVLVVVLVVVQRKVFYIFI